MNDFERGLCGSVFLFLADIPFQHLQLERLEPKEAEVCAGALGAFGLRGYITTRQGVTCRFVVWGVLLQDQVENARYGWVLRGANAPDHFEGYETKLAPSFVVALERYLEGLVLLARQLAGA